MLPNLKNKSIAIVILKQSSVMPAKYPPAGLHAAQVGFEPRRGTGQLREIPSNPTLSSSMHVHLHPFALSYI
jgi:hypothetical protein